MATRLATMPVTVRKAFIYLTRGDTNLLVLAHPCHPEAGLQVPAGTVKIGEATEATARRELIEESGLRDFCIRRFLGEQVFAMKPFGKDEFHHRSFYHAVLTGPALERWRHAESHSGADPIPLELFWWNLNESAPNLVAGHGALLDRL